MRTPSFQCPVTLASRITGGKWKARILHLLIENEKLRFSEIRQGCPPISDRILSLELKALEEWNLIERKEFPVVPPKTEYRMTDFGKSLEPVMAAMAEWSQTYGTRIEKAAKADDQT